MHANAGTATDLRKARSNRGMPPAGTTAGLLDWMVSESIMNQKSFLVFPSFYSRSARFTMQNHCHPIQFGSDGALKRWNDCTLHPAVMRVALRH